MIEAQAATAEAPAQGAKKSGVGRVVFLSSQGAQLESGTGPVVALHHAEKQLIATGVPLTLLRAPYFYENWAGVVPMAREQGVLPSFLPADFRMLSVAARDIGGIAPAAPPQPPTRLRAVQAEGAQPS